MNPVTSILLSKKHAIVTWLTIDIQKETETDQDTSQTYIYKGLIIIVHNALF